MRFLRTAVWFVLALSILANIFVFKHYTSGRTILSVNGDSITKKMMDDYLEQQFSPQYKAVNVARMLTDQEARKSNLVPTDQDVEEAFEERKERNWHFALQLSQRPWLLQENKDEIRQEIEQDRLLARGFTATDDEIREEYQGKASNGMLSAWLYDTPNLAKTEVAIVRVPGIVGDIQQLMGKSDPPVKPSVISQQYPDEVRFLGDNDMFTFVQPYGSNLEADIFNIAPNSVKVMEVLPQFQDAADQNVNNKMVVRMMAVTPGHKADLNDPKTKEKIRIALAKKRANWPELFGPLFDRAIFESEIPGDREVVERLLFPAGRPKKK